MSALTAEPSRPGPLERLDDRALMAEVVGRNPDAVEVLWRRHSSAVLGVARRVTQNHALAEEILQEVFLRLWRAPERFDGSRGALRSFLLMEANGRSIDAIRSDVSRKGVELRTAPTERTAGDPVAAEVWDGAVADHIQEALEDLPSGERDAIELAFFGHHPYKTVATILGLPEGTVKSRIRSGLQRMRDRLVAADIGEPTWTNE